MTFDDFLDAIRMAYANDKDLLASAWMRFADSGEFSEDHPLTLSASAYLEAQE